MSMIGIARSGLDASLLRLTASASNIANAQSTGPLPGNLTNGDGARAYRPMRALSAPVAQGGVTTTMVLAEPGYRLTYDPGSPHSDARGLVAAPAVSIVEEMVEQLAARRAFEANLKVLDAAVDQEKRIRDLWA
jgi:flagellar basal-body rod protein FlgC